MRALLLAVLAALALPAPAAAGVTGVWGPTLEGGFLSAYPRYAELGARVHNVHLFWDEQARRRPRRPADPRDPAYRWRRDLDRAIEESRESGVRLVVTLHRTPLWATSYGTVDARPDDLRDWRAFVTAAARRFRAVRHWRIWESPNFGGTFQPLAPQIERNEPLTATQRLAPRLYADMLDAAYSALKRVDRRNLVIGGNLTTSGDIAPRPYLRALRTSAGRRPRMSFFGFDPQSDRLPLIGELPPSPDGFADLADLPRLMRWLDRDVRRGVRVWIGSYELPIEDRARQAELLRNLIRHVRRTRRIAAFSYRTLTGPRGLFDESGRDTAASAAFREASS